MNKKEENNNQSLQFKQKLRKTVLGDFERYELERDIRNNLKEGLENKQFSRKELGYISQNIMRIKKIVEKEVPSGIYFLLYRNSGSISKLSKRMGIYRNGIYYWIKRFKSISLINENKSKWDKRKKVYIVNKSEYPELTNEVFQMILKHHGREKIKELTEINQDPTKSGDWS